MRMKRALVTLILHFARIYGVTSSVTRDSPEPEVRTSYRKVLLKAHPDKPGGSEDAAKKLTGAYRNWQDAAKHPGKAVQVRAAGPRPRNVEHRHPAWGKDSERLPHPVPSGFIDLPRFS